MKAAFRKIKLLKELQVLQQKAIHFDEIDSTNRFLLDSGDLKNGTVVLADFQTAGRGRFDRSWQSPPRAALLFSILLNAFPPEKSPHIYPFLTAIGVYKGLREMLPNDVKLSVKWPNDVLLNGRKVCGILVQGKIADGHYEKIVVGVGLNVNQPPQFFTGDLINATSLSVETGINWNRLKVFKYVLLTIDHLLIILQKMGENTIIEMWKDACDSLGRQITIDDGKMTYRGCFEGLSEDGGLQLRISSGSKTFYAGDVTVVKE